MGAGGLCGGQPLALDAGAGAGFPERSDNINLYLCNINLFV